MAPLGLKANSLTHAWNYSLFKVLHESMEFYNLSFGKRLQIAKGIFSLSHPFQFLGDVCTHLGGGTC